MSIQGPRLCAIVKSSHHHHDNPQHTTQMAVLTRLVGRVWNLICTIILGVFFAFPLAILACITTGLAIIFTWILASRMIAAAVSKRIDFWRSVDHQPGIREAQIDEAVRHLATGPSLVQTSRPRSVRTMSSGSRMQASSHDLNFDSNYDYDYGYEIAEENVHDDDDSGALYLGGWRRRNSRTSPTSSRPTTPGTAAAAAYQYRPRSNSNGGGGRGTPNFSSPYGAGAARFDTSSGTLNGAPNYYPSVTLPPAVPVANVAARRSTTSVGSRRSSRVLSAENVVRGDMGEEP